MDYKNLSNNMADDDNINNNDSSKDEQNLNTPKKDHDILEIINVLSDENSDINTIGREGQILSDRIDVNSTFDDIDEDTSVGRSIVNIDRDEIKESKKWEDSFNKSSSDTLDEIINNKEKSSNLKEEDSDTTVSDENASSDNLQTQKSSETIDEYLNNIFDEKNDKSIDKIKIAPVKKIAGFGKFDLDNNKKEEKKEENFSTKQKEKSKDLKKQPKQKNKVKISEMFTELFQKHKKLLIVFLVSLFIFIAFGVAFYTIVISKPPKEIEVFELDEYSRLNSTVEKKRSGTYHVLDEGYFDGGEIYFLKEAENRQQLSLIIKSKNGKVIVFDGGWAEDAPKLTSLIKELGGTVHYWFITHGDPDHVGALYEIADSSDLMGIKIERIVYSFFKKEIYNILGVEEPWFYGALIDRFMDLSEKKNVAILNDLTIDQVIKIDDVSVRILNDTRHLFRVDNYFDNNSSCCYKVTMNDKSITVLGDIAKDASDFLLRLNSNDVLKTDIVVLAHHGQDGAKKDLYEVMAPEICLWGTPDWLYENKQGRWDTHTTIKWMQDMQIKKHCISKDGDWIIR